MIGAIYTPAVPWYVLMWQEMCPHHNDVLVVLETAATCETTQAFCLDCHKEWPVKTDCA